MLLCLLPKDVGAEERRVVLREDFQSGLSDRSVERGFPSIARKSVFSLGLEADGNRYLRVESDDSYSAKGVFVRLSPQLCPEVGWRWMVSDVIATADIGRKEGDAAAAKL